MITYGFFNAVDGDRKYDAATFNTFFEGLIAANGIFENVENGFRVRAAGGLNVNVESGKAIVNGYWVKNNATEVLTLATAHNLLGRYDMVTLRWSSNERAISLNVTTGTPASTPIKPVPIQNEPGTHEIALAYIYVGPNASTITPANITDTRYSTALCGMIHGLIEQVDTSTLYNQYAAQFEALSGSMKTWQDAQQAAFESWLSALTEQLQVNTYIEKTQANYIVTSEKWYIQIPEQVDYQTTDILDVFINGIFCVENLDYTIEENEVEGGYMVRFVNSLQASNDPSQTVTFRCLKSKIGATV